MDKGSNLEIINCGSYSSWSAGSFDMSTKTPKYASLVLYQNIFLGNITKVWIDSGNIGNRSTQVLTVRYSSPTFSWSTCKSYTGTQTADYVTFSVYVVII